MSIFIKIQESAGLKHFNDSKAFIEYSNDADDIYISFEEYNPNKKRKISIAFDDLIANILSNKKLNPIVTELFIRARKLNIYLVFYYQILFCSTPYFILKIPNSQALQQLAFNHSSNI